MWHQFTVVTSPHHHFTVVDRSWYWRCKSTLHRGWSHDMAKQVHTTTSQWSIVFGMRHHHFTVVSCMWDATTSRWLIVFGCGQSYLVWDTTTSFTVVNRIWCEAPPLHSGQSYLVWDTTTSQWLIVFGVRHHHFTVAVHIAQHLLCWPPPVVINFAKYLLCCTPLVINVAKHWLCWP